MPRSWNRNLLLRRRNNHKTVKVKKTKTEKRTKVKKRPKRRNSTTFRDQVNDQRFTAFSKIWLFGGMSTALESADKYLNEERIFELNQETFSQPPFENKSTSMLKQKSQVYNLGFEMEPLKQKTFMRSTTNCMPSWLKEESWIKITFSSKCFCLM